MRAMILAAGLGTRMRPLTLHTPKPLLEVGGKPILQHHIERLRDAGFRQLVINHAWLGEQIEQRFGDGAALGVEIAYSPESEPLETAGGIRKALSLLSPDGEQPFVVVNGDIFSDYPFTRLPETIDGVAHLVLVDNPPHNPEGDFGLVGEKLTAEDGERLTFSGISVLSPRLLDGIALGNKAPLGPLLRDAIANGRVSGEHFKGYWVDVGTPQRLDDVDNWIEENGIDGI